MFETTQKVFERHKAVVARLEKISSELDPLVEKLLAENPGSAQQIADKMDGWAQRLRQRHEDKKREEREHARRARR
jgi:hypothetical protein